MARIAHWEKEFETTRQAGGQLWADTIRRDHSAAVLPPPFLNEPKEIRDEVLYRVTYRGYMEREQRQIEKQKHVEKILIPTSLDYRTIPGLRKESALKLQEFRPHNLGQASRISGVNPADISILMVRIASLTRGSRRSDPAAGA